MSLEPGPLVDRYRIDRLLGAGGMGSVYVAFDTRLERQVALKVLGTGEVRPSDDASLRFVREARAAAALHHPNVVTVFDAGTASDGRAYIAMELLDGASLRAQVGKRDVGISERLRWLVDVARALAAAHAAGLVHRDIKPENVVLTKDGTVKVLDFGIARRVTTGTSAHVDDATATALTAPQTLIGTIAYMAPEQVRREQLDGRADQFAWAVMAYELLAGAAPWRGDGVAMLAQIVSSDPEALRSVAPDVPEAVAGAVMRALEKNRDRRFPTMEALLEALDVNVSVNVVTGDIARQTTVLASTGTAAGVSREQGDPAKSGRAIAVAAVLLLAVAAIALIKVRGRAAAAPAASASASAHEPVTLLTLPPPTGCNAEASKQYVDGMRLEHSGAWALACHAFGKAAGADDTCAAAHMRAAWICREIVLTSETHGYFSRAAQLRDQLSPRDRSFLDAMAPVLGRDPPDPADSARRMAALADANPDDAELACEAAYASRSPDEKRRRAHHASLLDPTYSDALQTEAFALIRLGQVDAAIDTVDKCAAIATTGTDCFFTKTQLLMMEGRNAEALGAARQMIARAADSDVGYELAMIAMAGDGAPRGAIDEALTQLLPHVQDDVRERTRLFYGATTLALYGAPEDAEAPARELARATARLPDLEPHVRASLLLLEILDETGKTAEAAKLAADFVGRSAVWLPAVSNDWSHIGLFRYGPEMLEVERRARVIDDAGFTSAIAKWTTAQISSGASPHDLWAAAWALPARSRQEALAALAQPGIQSARSWNRRFGLTTLTAFEYLAAGHALALAGRLDEAIPVLQYGTKAGTALREPIPATRGQLWLAQALADQHRNDEACRAIALIEQRWGKSKKSVTLAAARRLAAAIKCSK